MLSNQELYHYGVMGMRWGVRKSKPVSSAKKRYKQTSKDLRKAKTKYAFSKSTYIAGTANNKKRKKDQANIKKLTDKKLNDEFKVTDKQANYAYNKKLKSSGSKEKANKAKMNVYVKSMNKKLGGLPGSINDVRTGGRDTKYISHITKTKGKKYADEVEKKYKNRSLKKFAAAESVSLGMMAYCLYKMKRL